MRLAYRPALDGVRGVAIIAVILCHAGAMNGGYLGVDLFFVLSGFLITTLLLEEWGRVGTISLNGFYRRRAARLLPALVTMLTVLFLIVVAAIASGSTPASALVNLMVQSCEGLFYVTNFAYAFGHPPTELAHLWSLAEEEQFYLLWPPLLLIALRKRTSMKTIALMLCGSIVVLAANRVCVYELGGSWDWLMTSPQTRSDPIVVGCLAAVLRHVGWTARFASGRAALVGFAAVVAVMAFAGFSHAAFAYGLLPFGLLTAAVVLGVVDHPACLAGRLLSVRPLRFVGRISYSLYLWHSMFVTGHHGAILATGLCLSFALACLSHRYVEVPLRLKLGGRTRERSAVVLVPA